jgi:CBS domain-containing protein
MNGSMFFDIRTIHGDLSFEQQLKSQIAEHLERTPMFLAHTAANTLSFKTPLGWFGRIKTIKKGEHQGKIDIKKAGIFAVTEGIKVLALEANQLNGGTQERLQDLIKASVLTPELGLNLKEGFDFLVFLRLRSQVKAILEKDEPTNYLSLDLLNRMEKERLKLALTEVQSFQDFLKRHFKLDLINQ